MGRTQPVREEEFVAWARSLASSCTERQTEWGLDPATVQKLNTLTHDAGEAYEHNRNTEYCNRASRVHKDACIAALRQFLRFFIPTLRANEAVEESDLKALGLPSRKRHARQPLPEPREVPEVYVTKSNRQYMKVHVRIPQHGHPTQSRTRKAYHGFTVRYRKEDETGWHDEYTTRLHLNLVFGDEDRGKRLLLMAAWINPRLQRGPWSTEMNVIIH